MSKEKFWFFVALGLGLAFMMLVYFQDWAFVVNE